MASIWPKIIICIIGLLVKASWMQCPLHNQKLNKPGFHGASCQLAPPNIWIHKVQYLPASLVYGEWIIPCMSASANECRSIGSCNSSGLCAELLITGFHFQLLLTLPPSDTKCQLLTAREVVTWTSLGAAGDREVVAVIAFPSQPSTVSITNTKKLSVVGLWPPGIPWDSCIFPSCYACFSLFLLFCTLHIWHVPRTTVL